MSFAFKTDAISDLNTAFDAGYEEEIFAVDVAFVVFTIHAFTGERLLTRSRCSKNMIQHEETSSPLVVGPLSPLVVVDTSTYGGLLVSLDGPNGYEFGVSGLRKFFAQDRLRAARRFGTCTSLHFSS